MLRRDNKLGMLITDHTLEENLHYHPQRPLGITLPHLYPTVKHSQSVKTMYSDITSLVSVEFHPRNIN